METSITFVCALGIGTVFIGLICIVLLCKVIGLICGNESSAQTETPKAPAPAPVAKPANEVTANRGEIVAAISAAIAEELGTDVTGIKILSIKKI